MGLFNFTKKKSIPKQLLEQYKFQAQRCLEIYDDSQRLFQSTVNPEVFFMRYELAIEQLKELQRLIDVTANAIGYKGDNLAKKIKLLENKRDEMYRTFICRHHQLVLEKADKLKTDKGKTNNLAKSKDSVLKQKKYLSSEHISYINNVWE